jgi:hypothetical protein
MLLLRLELDVRIRGGAIHGYTGVIVREKALDLLVVLVA